jgi:hypothetical protein
MHFNSIIMAVSALILGTASAAAVEKRLPRHGAFGVSPEWGCPLVQPQLFEFTYGNDCGKCQTFNNDAVMKSVDVYWMDEKCVITVYNTHDCSDPGTQSGRGCWSPEGGIAGWTITCPGEDPNNTYMPVCRAPVMVN